MKICKNCGARYKEGQNLCPYCGAEDRKLSKRRYREKVDGLRRQRQNIRRLPQIIPRRAVKFLGIGILAAVALLVLSLVILLIVQTIKKPREQHMEEENIARMEEYLQNEQFRELRDFYLELPHVYAKYDKYKEIADVYYYYMALENSLEQYRRALELPEKETTGYRNNLMKSLKRLRDEVTKRTDDQSRMGNEGSLRSIYEKGLDGVCDALSIEREEAEKLLSESF